MNDNKTNSHHMHTPNLGAPKSSKFRSTEIARAALAKLHRPEPRSSEKAQPTSTKSAKRLKQGANNLNRGDTATSASAHPEVEITANE